MTTQQPGPGRDACPPPEASSHENTSGVRVELVFWAGARAIAGMPSQTWPVSTIGAALKAAAQERADPRFDRLLAVCTVLVNGVAVRRDGYDTELTEPVRAEILPPFAGG